MLLPTCQFIFYLFNDFFPNWLCRKGQTWSNPKYTIGRVTTLKPKTKPCFITPVGTSSVLLRLALNSETASKPRRKTSDRTKLIRIYVTNSIVSWANKRGELSITPSLPSSTWNAAKYPPFTALCNILLCTSKTKIKRSMEKGSHCLSSLELLVKKIMVLFTMVDNRIVQMENQTHFLLHQNWLLTNIWHSDAGDARRLYLVLFMFANQLYFYVLGPINSLGY